MKDLKTYILIVLMFLVVQETLSPQTLGDLGYSEYDAFPATDWELANPNRTTSHQLFGAKTTGESGEYQYYEELQSEDASPKVLLAQGEYIMISIPGYDQCGKFDVYEDKQVDGLEKECIMTPKENVFWICDFTPGEDHSINVFDKMGTKLLTTSFNSLPSEPPDITYNFIESGAGWIMVKVKVADESAPNLVGVEVLYKRQDDEFWWRSYMESVSYKDDSPRVVPVHYCPEFLEDRTFCLLLSDGTWIKDEKEREVEYQFKMSAFRIGPYGRIFGPATDETYTYRYCDWLQLNCNPPMGSSDEYEIYEDEIDTSIEKETSVKRKKGRPPPSGAESGEPGVKGEQYGTTSNVTVTTLPPFLLSTTWAPEMWIENVTKPHPDILVDSNDLWVLYLALLIILISILLPLAFCLGTRAGYHEAEGYWTELSSTGGNVNISLGYVGTEWTRPVPESNA